MADFLGVNFKEVVKNLNFLFLATAIYKGFGKFKINLVHDSSFICKKKNNNKNKVIYIKKI